MDVVEEPMEGTEDIVVEDVFEEVVDDDTFDETVDDAILADDDVDDMAEEFFEEDPTEPYARDYQTDVLDEPDYSEVPTVDDVTDRMSTDFGDVEWSDIKGDLVSEETRNALVSEYLNAIMAGWDQSSLDLPPVCDAGVQCQEAYLADALMAIKQDWSDALEQIDRIFEQTVEQVKQLMVEGYEEAYECDPGCTCTNIEIEFNDIISAQRRIVENMQRISEDLDYLYDTEVEILEICPDYATLEVE